MTDEATITTAQLRTLMLYTELSGNRDSINRFSYAQKGDSTYSFGVAQFDVGNNRGAQDFLRENGFTNADIAQLSRHGGLSRQQLDALDAKLQAIPQENMDRFVNNKLDQVVDRVSGVIERVRAINPAAADAIVADPRLQLAIADYSNQFGQMGNQFVGYLAGQRETLQGGRIQAGNPPTREDVQRFIDNTKYGVENPRPTQRREDDFTRGLEELGLNRGAQQRSQPAPAADQAMAESVDPYVLRERLGYGTPGAPPSQSASVPQPAAVVENEEIRQPRLQR